MQVFCCFVLILRAAALPPTDEVSFVQMKLWYDTFASFLLYLIDWLGID